MLSSAFIDFSVFARRRTGGCPRDGRQGEDGGGCRQTKQEAEADERDGSGDHDEEEEDDDHTRRGVAKMKMTRTRKKLKRRQPQREEKDIADKSATKEAAAVEADNKSVGGGAADADRWRAGGRCEGGLLLKRRFCGDDLNICWGELSCANMAWTKVSEVEGRIPVSLSLLCGMHVSSLRTL